MIRPATLQDVKSIYQIARTQAERYPLKPDSDKISSGIRKAVSSAQDFVWVDEDSSGNIRAVLLALTGDNLWAQRKFSSVTLWWSDNPGRGVALLRKFADWVKSRRIIRVAGFAPDLDLDSRTLRLLELCGFRRHGGAYLLYN